LDLKGSHAATIFDLLRPAKFVLLTLDPAPPAPVAPVPPGAPVAPVPAGAPVAPVPAGAPDAPVPAGAPDASVPVGYADRLDVVTAELAEDHPAWTGLRSVLIRPDGYVAWATSATDPPPLTTWLGTP